MVACEKQRVALARAPAVRPELLLLDEPFSALNKNIRLSLRRELKNLHRQIPFILVTHDEDEAEFLGDQIISIEKGEVREVKTPTCPVSITLRKAYHP